MFNFLDNVASNVGNFFSVDDSYTPGTPMSSPDAIKTIDALSDLGYFGVNGESEFTLPNSVKAFQDAHGLKIDGVINKGGPTEKAISGALEQQNLNTTKPMEIINSSAPSHVTVSKPVSSKPDQNSFTASASFGPRPNPVPKPKINPMTGVADQLANAPKPNKSVKKAWNEYYKTREQKVQKAIVPEGKTTQQAIMSMMQDPRYGDKHDTRLRDHVVKQFERAFPGEVQYDETGKMVQPTAVISPDQIAPFDPDDELKAITATAETSSASPAIAAKMIEDTQKEKTPQASAYSQEDDWDQNNPERTWSPDEERKTAEENISKQVKESIDGRKLKGTTFFGGAGMEGGYIEDMVKSLEEAGLNNVRAADPKKWSRGGMGQDAVSVPMQNDRDRQPSDFSGFGEEGEQFNLVGYSYGGLQAAQAAADYADSGGVVDNLVLMGTPVEKGFLEKLHNHPNIKSVRIVNLEEQNDPIKAGMSDAEVIGAVPKLGLQWIDDKEGKARGHFYYSDEGEAGKKRRRALASKLATWGLK